MSTRAIPDLLSQPPAVETGYLRQIADVLGVPISAFVLSGEPQLFHTGGDGTRCFLVVNAVGVPVVRSIVSDVGDGATDQRISEFLAHDLEGPSQQTLAALLDRLLLVHLSG